MPWKTSDAPEGLPEHAKEIWAKAATAALKQYGDDEKAIATAWAAVKKAGYAKGEDGKWHKVELTEEHVVAFRENALKQTGKHWGKVLRHVAFLGAQAPAVKGLAAARDLGNETFEKEICAVGTWNGEKIDEADIDEIVTNFHALKAVERVPLLMAAVHDEDKFDEILEKEGLPSLAWVDDVWRRGTRMVARFTQAAKIAKDLIMQGRFPECSIRFTKDYVFGEASTGDVSVYMEIEEKEGSNMAEAKFTEDDLERARAKAAEDAKATAEASFKEKLEALKADAEAKGKKLTELAEARRKEKIGEFKETYGKAGVKPALLDPVVEFLEKLDSQNVVEFSEKTKAPALDRGIAVMAEVLKAAGEEGEGLFVPVEDLAETPEPQDIRGQRTQKQANLKADEKEAREIAGEFAEKEKK